MQPGIQPTIITQGADTQPTPSVRNVEAESPRPTTPTGPLSMPLPFWRGVIAATVVVVVISAVLAGILLILPAAH